MVSYRAGSYHSGVWMEVHSAEGTACGRSVADQVPLQADTNIIRSRDVARVTLMRIMETGFNES